jgi:hypothetical protein
MLHCKHKKNLTVWKAIHQEEYFEAISKRIAPLHEIQVPYLMNENVNTTGALQKVL